MKQVQKTLLVLTVLCGAAYLCGCDNGETIPDPAIKKSADAQRAAQQPGQAPNAPTGPTTAGK